MKIPPAFTGFCLGVLVAVAVDRVLQDHADPTPTVELRQAPPILTVDAVKESRSGKNIADEVKFFVAMLEEGTGIAPDEAIALEERLSRAGGAAIAMDASFRWAELCAAQGYPGPHPSPTFYADAGRRIGDAGDREIAWLRTVAEIRGLAERSGMSREVLDRAMLAWGTQCSATQYMVRMLFEWKLLVSLSKIP